MNIFASLFGRQSVKGCRKESIIPKIEVANFQGIGKRPEQEDSFYVSDFTDSKLLREKGFLAVVADGMGGLANGAEMSAMITGVAKNYFEKQKITKYASEEDECLYLKGFLAAVREEAKRISSEEEDGEKGSTIVAIWMKGENMYLLSVGDSRIYLQRGEGLYQMTRDHNLYSKLAERMAKGELSKAEFEDISGKAGLTSFIGLSNQEYVDVSERAFNLKEGDKILLFTDGVFGTLSEQEIVQVCMEEKSELIAKNLRIMIEEINGKRQDNYTGVIISYKGRR